MNIINISKTWMLSAVLLSYFLSGSFCSVQLDTFLSASIENRLGR